MLNLYEYIANNSQCRKLEADELLIAKCSHLFEDKQQELWSPHNYIAFVLSGKNTWKSAGECYSSVAGEAYFIKKNTLIRHTSARESNLSLLLIFIPDEYIKEVAEQNLVPVMNNERPLIDLSIIPVHVDLVLKTYFESVLSYFTQTNAPAECLLAIKLTELIIDIFYSEKNVSLATYFRQLCCESTVSISQVMQSHFTRHIPLAEIAKLCGKSLSAFKRDFMRIYGTSPGKWVIQKRLAHGKYLLETTFKDINEIALASGFENTSHFIRIFKQQYGAPPHKYKTISQEL